MNKSLFLGGILMTSIDEQIKIISKGAAEIIDIQDLRRKLEQSIKENRPLTVKLGLDPTAPDIHLGHSVVLRKIRQMQDLGHKAIIIIGDFTGMIGDPTGKSKARKQLSKEEVLINAKTYEEQIFKILRKDSTEVRFNSEWLSKMNFRDVIDLASKYTVARMLEREDFKNRFDNNLSVGIHEFFYPLMQAYDSVCIKADIELGGTDQRFNVLMGRTIQKDYGMESQVALFMPLLEGTDGKEKMSKSLGNYIGINEDPKDIYGKAMSIPDSMIIKYFELTTDIHPDTIDEIKNRLENGKANPRDIKMELAKEVVKLYHGEEQGEAAEEYFKKVFQCKEIPKELPTINLCQSNIGDARDIINIIASTGLAGSKSEARRLLSQGAVKLNNEKITENMQIDEECILQVGKKNFLKITL